MRILSQNSHFRTDSNCNYCQKLDLFTDFC
ncbi:hypothetical protein OESDEN_23341 [Oesophagostomum dentatum]|uniref:Uncharacterized protein n=1 Tax=Oesophagostomum dentatum TaxID=61180 RepID=A0A0B1RWJ2_OESDE|nr:hypothetical protein OESDEN_23341 [Oesophagostomum dentatum]